MRPTGKQSAARLSQGRVASRHPRTRRRGLGAVEVIVVLVVVIFLGLMLVMAMPRQRESARSVSCQKNLMQIGTALRLYQQASGHLPIIPQLGSENASSPLSTMLGELGLADFTTLDPQKPPPTSRGRKPGEVVERPVPGFTCPSDTLARSDVFPAPISYRATTGDRADGQTGPFAPGHVVRSAEVEAGDGLSYTAAFAERLVGTHRLVADPRNYTRVAGSVGDQGCTRAPDTAGQWHGDAGSSWLVADWRSTLYNHVLTPNAMRSCVADDGRSAAMGASSGHLNRVHVLLLDGSVRPFTTHVDPKIWRGLANINDEGDSANQVK